MNILFSIPRPRSLAAVPCLLSFCAQLGCQADAPVRAGSAGPVALVAREEPRPEEPSETVAPAPDEVPPAVAPVPSAEQEEAYRARRPKTVIEAQLYRETRDAPFRTDGGQTGRATLVNLAPSIGVWWMLTLAWDDGDTETWHLENPAGLDQDLRLDPSVPAGLVLKRRGVDHPCALWSQDPTALHEARSSGAAYAPLCDGAIALRNPTVGSRTRMEWTTDFLRDHVWGGEALTKMVKETFFVDSERQTAELAEGQAPASAGEGKPRSARSDPAVEGRLLDPVALGLPIDDAVGGRLRVGDWYPLHGVSKGWVSIFQPRFVDPEILSKNAPYVKKLDEVEGAAIVYTVAFDLADFDLGYEVGTDHPRVGWSGHVPASVRRADLPGPDGYGDTNPLARTGQLDPAYLSRLVGVFVGGFKRAHGAMISGPLALQNGGSHYGFVEFGTELSHLQPGLSTLVVWADQRVELRTWTEEDAARLWQVRHARQNGVPLVETDPVTGEVHPGALVSSWGGGNWSGSADGTLRSVRSGVCIQESEAGRFLLYSYFSSATPSAMADVFSAYQCSYAMALDMNALEHTYLAVHIHEDGGLSVRQLVEGMEVLDRQKGDATYPRFVGYADNRDFFYLLRKQGRGRN